ncbi:hypothetical protein J5N97_015568 [Dioscorea zingiberensis]|uniref:Uncharacterized protein n=1 Tax=Dioscorea zingiberensis TaxID=325984 RepID=A0A9D5CHV5_9LILI|nr:hypothetical protein J5N97_015568 [Dioscorea zingiberensis]
MVALPFSFNYSFQGKQHYMSPKSNYLLPCKLSRPRSRTSLSCQSQLLPDPPPSPGDDQEKRQVDQKSDQKDRKEEKKKKKKKEYRSLVHLMYGEAGNFGRALKESLSPKHKGDWKDLFLMSFSFAVYVYISQKIVCAYCAWMAML